MDSAESVRDFLMEQANFDGPRSELTGDLPLIENGIVDSMTLLRMIAWLEAEFGIQVEDADVVPGNFGSIEQITRLVESRLVGSDRS
ncbi:MAG: acyl carrier protein [Actinobacteria bacterium]|nr:acyl carrier protein [Actinomycetota bacterium]